MLCQNDLLYSDRSPEWKLGSTLSQVAATTDDMSCTYIGTLPISSKLPQLQWVNQSCEKLVAILRLI